MEEILQLIHITEFLVHNLVRTCRGKCGKLPTEFSLNNDMCWVYLYHKEQRLSVHVISPSTLVLSNIIVASVIG
jgi:hypothetical protein